MRGERRRLVAVVDADDAVRDAIATLLRIEGLHAISHASAEQFLDDPDGPGADRLVVEQDLPRLSGLALIARMRQRDGARPVALMTQWPTPSLRRQAVLLGVAAVLEKPLIDQALLDFLRG